MERSGGNPGRSRGRAQTPRDGGPGGAARGRRNPQTSQPPGGFQKGGAGQKPAQTQQTAELKPSSNAPVAIGRARTHRSGAAVESAGGDKGPIDKGVPGNTDQVSRVFGDVVKSRPQELVSKAGTSGTRIELQTNYFRILKKPTWSIHQYRIDFSPEVDMIRLRQAYLKHHKETLGGYIFDGTVLFCATYFIPEHMKGSMELITTNREGEAILIKIKHVGIVESTDAQQLQVLNLTLRRAMAGLELQLVSRNFYDAKSKINLNEYRMEIWPGYQTSIRQHENDILLCAEISHKVMRTETVYDILRSCLNMGDYQQAFKQQVVGTIVLTDYNNKTYRVDDVDFQLSPSSTFPTRDGDVSYIQYYQKRYNLRIGDREQPLLVSRPTDKNVRGGQNEFINLIPELCRATGLTDKMRNDFRLMKAMGEHTRLNPNIRIDRLKSYCKRMHSSEASMNVFKSWNMQLDQRLVDVKGRVLKPENIHFGENKVYSCDQNADWTREFRNNSMYVHVDIRRWYVIVPQQNLREVQEFVRMCIKAAGGMKMHISEPRYEEIPDDRNGSYSQAIDRTTANDPQLLMVVLRNNNEEKYSCIKKKCCVDRPVPSQVVTCRTIAPKNKGGSGLMSIATKVVIQMNAKLMGAPWMINLPINGLMTVGFDVCHSAKDRNKSYGAFVATMDIRKSTKYFSAVTQHMKGQELSNEITLNMTCALKSYRENHGTLPERIVFYRDGVGDGQLHHVYSTEVRTIKKKLDEIYASAGIETGCRFAFIVVSKRINTRFFANGRNPVPGTVVDDVVTLPERYDFFLVSQSVRQGTVSPTSYNVIYDTLGLNADRVQMLTYKMTHLYYNWSGTLRVPAVCQYAQKLAFLVAEHIHRSTNSVLENHLFFL